MKFNNDKCPEPQPLGFSREKKGGAGKGIGIGLSRVPSYPLNISAVWNAQTMRNRRRNLTARDLRRPLKY